MKTKSIILTAIVGALVWSGCATYERKTPEESVRITFVPMPFTKRSVELQAGELSLKSKSSVDGEAIGTAAKTFVK